MPCLASTSADAAVPQLTPTRTRRATSRAFARPVDRMSEHAALVNASYTLSRSTMQRPTIPAWWPKTPCSPSSAGTCGASARRRAGRRRIWRTSAACTAPTSGPWSGASTTSRCLPSAGSRTRWGSAWWTRSKVCRRADRSIGSCHGEPGHRTRRHGAAHRVAPPERKNCWLPAFPMDKATESPPVYPPARLGLSPLTMRHTGQERRVRQPVSFGRCRAM